MRLQCATNERRLHHFFLLSLLVFNVSIISISTKIPVKFYDGEKHALLVEDLKVLWSMLYCLKVSTKQFKKENGLVFLMLHSALPIL